MFFEFSDWHDDAVALSLSDLKGCIELPYEWFDDAVWIDQSYSVRTTNDPVVCFPKLGPKSWRDTGSLRPVLAGSGLKQRTDALIRWTSDQQAYLAAQIAEAGLPLRLYLFDWVDFTQISEFRVTFEKGAGRLTSSIRRFEAEVDHVPTVLDFAAEIAQIFDCQDMIVDVAYLPSGACRLVEVNPPNKILPRQRTTPHVRLV